MAAYAVEDRQRLLRDTGIVRNRLKIDAAIGNARACLDLVGSGITLTDFLWGFVDGRPVTNHWRRGDQIPIFCAQSEAMSRALEQRGFKFVGRTICYAFMQAVGMVNDHTVTCFRHGPLANLTE